MGGCSGMGWGDWTKGWGGGGYAYVFAVTRPVFLPIYTSCVCYTSVMKTYSCYKCQTKKLATEFYKDSSRKQGISSKCKACAKETWKSIQETYSPEKRAETSAAKQRRKYANRVAKGKSINTKTSVVRKRLNSARRRVGSTQWEDRTITFKVFELKAYWNEIWPEEQLQVDHIIPVLHPLVCGLHVHNNIRLMTKKDNSIKSNLILTDEEETLLGFRKVHVNPMCII